MKKEKKCKDCALCERVYRKFGYGIYPDDVYLCSVTEEFTNKDGVCKRWQEKAFEYDLSAERLNKVEEDILAIKQLFKEKKIDLWILRRRKRRITT